MQVDVKITLVVKGQQLELTLAEAKELVGVLKPLVEREVFLPSLPWKPWYDRTDPMPFITYEVNTCLT